MEDTDRERVEERAESLAIEQEDQEVVDSQAQATAMLEESDARQEDREGTAREHRTSDETVDPT